MPLHFKVTGDTDVGLVRTANEDCLHLDEKNRVFAVCDGMGGHQAGEVASMMAADILDIIFNHFSSEVLQDQRLSIEPSLPAGGDILVKAIRLANRAIYNTAVEKPTLLGMGTTIVSLVLQDDVLSVAHVGDSRAYRVAERTLEPLTVDHSWVAEIQQNQKLTEEEAASVVGKNVITRALGVRETVEVDYRLIKVKAGDKFMICSDGLCGFADDDEMFSVIHRVRNDNERIVRSLIQMANDRGGADNVTVAVLEIIDASESDIEAVERLTIRAETPAELETEDAWLEKINLFITQREERSAHQPPGKPVKKSVIVLIFSLFVIIAAVIIYLSVAR
ncbi:MAG: Stp1/IreP family PP2C-type Ser/Thr phosphatase [Candidatus Zixiibacteriota bacterium]|nr:MAG: Stp1/IreP family PP2C-type Ser/Thr phosphatase [candidate division Zixibacteria bacterium]